MCTKAEVHSWHARLAKGAGDNQAIIYVRFDLVLLVHLRLYSTSSAERAYEIDPGRDGSRCFPVHSLHNATVSASKYKKHILSQGVYKPLSTLAVKVEASFCFS